jgi:prepilin-type processing-associated H-X9-DG protein
VRRNTPLMSMPAGAGPCQQWILLCTAGAADPGNRTTHTPRLGQVWAIGLMGYTMGNVLLPPNPKTPNCSVNGANTLENPGMMGMSSFHPGGANVVMTDGSVRFLKNSTNLATVWKLGSRAQSEVISADEY